jgi:RNA polymerase sigma-70 factor (ECF subfamily)
LYAEHRAAQQSFFQRRIRSKASAPDLAQEVYVRMLRLTDPSGIRNPAVYPYTVANNLVKEYAALDRRQTISGDMDDVRASEKLEPETTSALDGELDTRQRVAQLQVMLRELRPKCRAALILRFTHELSLGEVAEQFNRYGHARVEIDDPALRALRVSGRFDANDLDSLAAFLGSLDGVAIERTPTGIRVLTAAPPKDKSPPIGH